MFKKNIKFRPKASYQAKTPEYKKKKLDNLKLRWPEKSKISKTGK